VSDAALDPLEEQVRDALLHLYDVAYLQTHPLAGLGGGDGSALRGKALLQTLLDAVAALEPRPGTAAGSPAWRGYHLLELRYLEGLSVNEAVEQLAVSRTQYRRDHRRALGAVTSLLRDRLQLERAAEPPDRPDSREELALHEAEQMADRLTLEHVDAAAAVGDTLALLRSAAEEEGVALSLRAAPQLPPLYCDRPALRQVLFGLVSSGLAHAAGGGAIEVAARAEGGAVELRVTARPGPAGRTEAVAPDPPEVKVAGRLVEAMGGALRTGGEGEAAWWARVSLPTVERPVVLVLDNNPDFVGLVERFLGEEDWEVVGAPDVGRAHALAVERRPDVILLDVMMPGRDGWDLLLLLRGRPDTRSIPVVVCSVLYEPQVARSLGAVAYLAKPVSREALLRELARWRPGPGSAGGSARPPR
jgi:CheY-like chemotaxis protein